MRVSRHHPLDRVDGAAFTRDNDLDPVVERALMSDRPAGLRRPYH